MDLGKKIRLAILFSVGLVSCIASAMRHHVQHQAALRPDLTCESRTGGIWVQRRCLWWLTAFVHQGRSPNVHHGPWSISSSPLLLLLYPSSTRSLKNGGGPLRHLQIIRLQSARLLLALGTNERFTDSDRTRKLTTSTATLAVFRRRIIWMMSQVALLSPIVSTWHSSLLHGLNSDRTWPWRCRRTERRWTTAFIAAVTKSRFFQSVNGLIVECIWHVEGILSCYGWVSSTMSVSRGFNICPAKRFKYKVLMLFCQSMARLDEIYYIM